MSDKPISKGDLVMVVRPDPCCGADAGYGFTFEVLRMVSEPHAICGACKREGYAIIVFDGPPHKGGFDLRRLIRLDPDNLMDDVPTGEELTV